jgi:hypothetical protein
MIRLFIQAQEEYVANTYDFNNFNHELVNSEEFQTNLMLELLKSKRAIQSNIPNYEWVPVTKKIIDEVLPLLEKSDMSEIRCEITGLSTIYTTVLIEKEFLIGSIDKFYGNQFTVLGKILKYEEKGAYLPLESTILGQIDSSMLNKLDEGINRIYEILKPFQVSSQLDKSKNNLRVTGVPILKILPIAIYI